MTSGWKGESQRHILARKGIKTGNKKRVKRVSSGKNDIDTEKVRLIDNKIYYLTNKYNKLETSDAFSDNYNSDLEKLRNEAMNIKDEFDQLSEKEKVYMFQSMEPNDAYGAIELEIFTYDEALKWSNASGNISGW